MFEVDSREVTLTASGFETEKCGFIFDWLDALATVLLPGLITVFSILVVTL